MEKLIIWVNYSISNYIKILLEFVMATCNRKKMLEFDKLKAAFEMFDKVIKKKYIIIIIINQRMEAEH